jgi:hypothetical protein
MTQTSSFKSVQYSGFNIFRVCSHLIPEFSLLQKEIQYLLAVTLILSPAQPLATTDLFSVFL